MSDLTDRVLDLVPRHGSQLYAQLVTNIAAALHVEVRAVRAACTQLAAERRIVVEVQGGYDFVRRGEASTVADYPLRRRPSHPSQPRRRAARPRAS